MLRNNLFKVYETFLSKMFLNISKVQDVFALECLLIYLSINYNSGSLRAQAWVNVIRASCFNNPILQGNPTEQVTDIFGTFFINETN